MLLCKTWYAEKVDFVNVDSLYVNSGLQCLSLQIGLRRFSVQSELIIVNRIHRLYHLLFKLKMPFF